MGSKIVDDQVRLHHANASEGFRREANKEKRRRAVRGLAFQDALKSIAGGSSAFAIPALTVYIGSLTTWLRRSRIATEQRM